MHVDRVPTREASTAHLTTATNRTLDLALHSGDASRRADLQRAARTLCMEARRYGMRAEEVILLLKRTWGSRPEPRGMPREETARLFDALVTLCVEEYYRGAR